jgi:hypothetical protein
MLNVEQNYMVIFAWHAALQTKVQFNDAVQVCDATMLNNRLLPGPIKLESNILKERFSLV